MSKNKIDCCSEPSGDAENTAERPYVLFDINYYEKLARWMSDEALGRLFTAVLNGEDVDRIIKREKVYH